MAKFREGQDVWYIDEVNGRIDGKVTDTTSFSVFIHWEDMEEPEEHPLNTTDNIHIVYNGNR